jgi:hypothetical protein
MSKLGLLAGVALGMTMASAAMADEFALKSFHSGLCLAASGRGAVIAPCNGSDDQRFTVNGSGQIVHGDKCLFGRKSGGPLAQSSCAAASVDEKWQFIGERLNLANGTCMDIENASKDAGAKVINATCDGSSNQQWIRASAK